MRYQGKIIIRKTVECNSRCMAFTEKFQKHFGERNVILIKFVLKYEFTIFWQIYGVTFIRKCIEFQGIVIETSILLTNINNMGILTICTRKSAYLLWFPITKHIEKNWIYFNILIVYFKCIKLNIIFTYILIYITTATSRNRWSVRPSVILLFFNTDRYNEKS